MYNLPINSSNAYLFIIFAIFQGFLVILVLVLLIDAFVSSRKHRIEQNKVKEEAFKQAQLELDNAVIASEKIISDAKTTAARIISEVNLFSSNTSHEFASTVKTVLDTGLAKINTEIESISNQLKADMSQEKITTLSGFSSALNTFQTSITSDIQEYKAMIASSVLTVQDELKHSTVKYVDELQERLHAYEQSRKELIKAEATEILSQLCTTFLGQTMTVKDNEALIEKLVSDIEFSNLVSKGRV